MALIMSAMLVLTAMLYTALGYEARAAVSDRGWLIDIRFCNKTAAICRSSFSSTSLAFCCRSLAIDTKRMD